MVVQQLIDGNNKKKTKMILSQIKAESQIFDIIDDTDKCD